MESKAIIYEIYPGNSARTFINIRSLIFVKPELYSEWRRNPKSIDFKDILVDPQNPVIYLTSNYTLTVENVPSEYLCFWYKTADPMEIARQTADYGHGNIKLNEEEMNAPPITWSMRMYK